MKRISRRKFMRAVKTAVAAGVLLERRGLHACAAEEAAGKGTVRQTAQTAVIEGFPWGPGVTAVILALEQEVQAASVRAEDFIVTEEKRVLVTLRGKRRVTAAFSCDGAGNRIDGDSHCIRLELQCTPESGSPFYYDIHASRNKWWSAYSLHIALEEGAALTAKDGTPVDEIEGTPGIDWSNARIPQLELFDTTGEFSASDGRSLRYACYKPAVRTGDRLPLVIWLHGAGEGGTDPGVLLLGNEVTKLAGEAFQAAMGGAAYILAPQAPTFWMQYNEKGAWRDNPGVASVYTDALGELIDWFAEENPGIDPERILIGGCSNGGYMALNMVLHRPDFFAGAYLICEAYKDEGLTDGQLESILQVPVWFVYAENDRTVRPEEYEKPTIARLKAMGGTVCTSIFPDVRDTTGQYYEKDGTPYQYIGHSSWIYFFQDQCREDSTGENMWAWMGRQRKNR